MSDGPRGRLWGERRGEGRGDKWGEKREKSTTLNDYSLVLRRRCRWERGGRTFMHSANFNFCSQTPVLVAEPVRSTEN